MIVDTSAIIAILTNEEDAADLAAALLASKRPRISAVNYVEAAVVADARHRTGGRRSAFEDIIRAFRLEMIDVTPERAEAARLAYRKFGRGYHPARLNFGDCFAYALSKETGEPLLYKGADFAQTDLEAAL